MDGAEPRLLTDTENQILLRQHRHPREPKNPTQWPVYRDILYRHDHNLGTIEPAILDFDDVPHIGSVTHTSLLLRQIFPTSAEAKEAFTQLCTFRNQWLLARAGGADRSALAMTKQLVQHEYGINILALMCILVREADGSPHLSYTAEVMQHLFDLTNLPPSTRPSTWLLEEIINIQLHCQSILTV